LIFVGVVLGWQWFRSIAEWHVLYATNIYICVSNQWIGYAGHFWSLAVEEQFYLIWPAVVFFAPRQMLLNAILWSIFIGIISTPLIQVVFLATDLQTYVLPFCHFDALGLGALVAYYYILAPTQLSRAMPGRAAFLSMLSASALLYYGLNYVHYTPLGDFVNVRMFNVITALSIMYCVLEPNNSAIIVALEFWPVRNIGRISYGVYLIHNIVPLLYHGTRFDIQNRHSLLGFAVYLATTFAVAAASWRFFERPILGFKPAIDRLIANLAAQSATGRRATSAPRGDLGR
jgi:peptidoglycan/LPS O-acetylase OafA/YrhL